jgi:pimeloyl-ACP methyl ester carboxylesterase
VSTTLPRRAFLGARLPPDSEAFSLAGVRIAGVVAGGMAGAAGVEAGDVIVRIAGHPVRSVAELGAALRRAGALETAELVVLRGHRGLALTAPVTPCPVEAVDGQRVAYEVLDAGGARLRTIVTSPERGAPAAAVLVLQGIACESIDLGAAPDAPLAGLVHGWARAGVMTMRVDRPGLGDSEGGPCGELDLDADLAIHRAALAALAADPRRAGAPLVVFGHSVGGMAAAVLAAERAPDGVIVYGTSTSTWLDCVTASTRRQLALRGVAPDEIERTAAALRERAIQDGLSGRSAAYHRQLDALDLRAAWARVAAPVLALIGEHDWVVGVDEQPAGATVAVVPGLDHLLGWHATRESSLAAYGSGAFDPAIVTTTLDWIRAVVRSPA